MQIIHPPRPKKYSVKYESKKMWDNEDGNLPQKAALSNTSLKYLYFWDNTTQLFTPPDMLPVTWKFVRIVNSRNFRILICYGPLSNFDYFPPWQPLGGGTGLKGKPMKKFVRNSSDYDRFGSGGDENFGWSRIFPPKKIRRFQRVRVYDYFDSIGGEGAHYIIILSKTKNAHIKRLDDLRKGAAWGRGTGVIPSAVGVRLGARPQAHWGSGPSDSGQKPKPPCACGVTHS